MSPIISFVSIAITLLFYFIARKINEKKPTPLTTPIFLAVVFICLFLLLFRISYSDYEKATEVFTYFLGPATVALAFPLYHQRKLIKKHFAALLLGIVSGSFASISVSYYLAILFHIPGAVNKSFLLKTITTPVAVEIGRVIDANIKLIAIVVIVTGIVGAMFLGSILKYLNITHPVTKGLTFGVMSHGIGTAQAIKEGEEEGAISGVAMALTAAILSFLIPLVYFVIK
ncbi:LrgB family protein [Bacillus seohaeanensis]|jgi:predicted murein hydrolase (TIGR00659 family)|uniref:LrgB family protein n=1 Tax=Bacillus seohaeanensis TaxID=284580 RepID=A0ABW5RWI2_9BACI